ncbi:MAG TPA: tRNA guanosine(34) transglycosylase Tgt [Fimbriimonadaceae bacterium]|nr:tRNA guanosine(34) transglycosylase Tgt [Fimbriimonadaceae bacterium]
MDRVRFELLGECAVTGARRGRLHTAHGTVETPCFMPVGTYGAVKTLGSEDLEALGFELVLSNTYHLSQRPGAELIEKAGGLHEFMSWKGAILTDSGGFQVMSLAKSRKVTDAGVTFQSHIDGNEIFLSPERSIEIQAQFGVDVSIALDVCPAFPATRDEVAEAMRRTHLWAPRNIAARRRGQSVFGIVQGGVHEDLRAESAEYVSSLDFDGVAIGGVSVGESTELQRPVVEYTTPKLPKEKPRYLMGVGHPSDIIHAVSHGVDMFDCVLPTRMARHHSIYTMRGRVNAAGKEWAEHFGPFDEGSVFPQTERYSAAYVRHLFKTDEPLAARIATLHNLAFYARLMREIRAAIESGGWKQLEKRYAEA